MYNRSAFNKSILPNTNSIDPNTTISISFISFSLSSGFYDIVLNNSISIAGVVIFKL